MKTTTRRDSRHKPIKIDSSAESTVGIMRMAGKGYGFILIVIYAMVLIYKIGG